MDRMQEGDAKNNNEHGEKGKESSVAPCMAVEDNVLTLGKVM